jgi:hypothetical protein
MVFPSEFVGDGDSFSPCDECAPMTSLLWRLCQGAVPQKVYISVLCRALGSRLRAPVVKPPIQSLPFGLAHTQASGTLLNMTVYKDIFFSSVWFPLHRVQPAVSPATLLVNTPNSARALCHGLLLGTICT